MHGRRTGSTSCSRKLQRTKSDVYDQLISKPGRKFNPQIIGRSETFFDTKEGCLSLNGTRKTRRYHSIEVLYMNRNFRQKMRTLEGFTAQIVQHEIDHTKGILI
ncbi:MAG: peptide deformylase [Spirochaetales bacterium]|nr:peptide deformylase [Spirochaetales bacterium]